MHILDNLYWLNGMIYGTLGNAYAIRNADSLTLIDCGLESDYESLCGALADWGLDELPIRHVLLTHGHRDHAGNARNLQKRGAKIVVHEEDAWQLRRGGFTPDMYPHTQGLDFSMSPVEPDALIHDGDELEIEGERFRVIGAPGHTRGSVVYEWKHQGKTLFFTGDVCSCDGETGDGVILGWKGSPDYDSKAYLQTLDMLFKFNPDIVLGGHGFPRMRDGGVLLRTACYTAMLEYR